jgi:YHS domain-containing protein
MENFMPSGMISQTAIAFLLLASVAATTAQEPTNNLGTRDQLIIAAQKICPVMGKPLGSMGTPVKMKIGEEELFLCCKACATKQISREHWTTIHTNLREAQGTCPVMGKPVPAGSKWTVVQGQLFYVCCPPCIEKIQADPTTYLTKLDALYAAHAAVPTDHDSIRIAVQGICPVMGKPLGSMGTPIKVKIGEEELFLCCKACRKGQVDRAHWATIHSNFARAQGHCPVMKKPLPANPRWTIVKGQIIYVCCPPCIEKMQAEPETYSAALDKLYLASLKAAPSVQ